MRFNTADWAAVVAALAAVSACNSILVVAEQQQQLDSAGGGAGGTATTLMMVEDPEKPLLIESLGVQVDFGNDHGGAGGGDYDEDDLVQGLLIDRNTILWSPHQDADSYGDWRDFEADWLKQVGGGGKKKGGPLGDWDKSGGDFGEYYANHLHGEELVDSDDDDDHFGYGDFEHYDDWHEKHLELMDEEEETSVVEDGEGDKDHASYKGLWALRGESFGDHEELSGSLADGAAIGWEELDDDGGDGEDNEQEEEDIDAEENHAQRGLSDSENDWSIPTKSELFVLIQKHIEDQKEKGKVSDTTSLVREIGMKLLSKHPESEEWKELLHEQVMDELKSLLDESSPERVTIDVELTMAKGRSPCGLAGHCEGPYEAESIKSFIKDMLDEYADEGENPSGAEILKRLQEELDMEPGFANELVNSNPQIRKFIDKQTIKMADVALSTALKDQATQVANSIRDLARNGTDVDDILDVLGLSEEEVMQLIHAMSKSQTKSVLKALRKPLKEMKERMKEADQKHANDTHVYFEEIITDDNETESGAGERRLRFIRHPSKKSMEDHIADIEEKLRQRRLARRSVPEDTADFSRRLSDHIEELQGHVRELKKAACPAGESQTVCDANRLDEVSKELSTMGTKALSAVAPFSMLLGRVSSGIRSIDIAEKVGEIVITALLLASKIPKIGVVFTIAKNSLGPVHDIMEKVDTAAGKFQKTVGRAWDNSIGRVEDVIRQFDSGAVAGTVAGAAMVGTIATSTCMRTLINDLAGFNLVGGVEDAVSALSKYMHILLDALHGLVTALASNTLKGISNTLDAIVKGVDPIASVFNKFEPLANLITRKIRIPWFKLPTAQKRFGMAACPSGYRPDYKTAGLGKTCWEKDSRDWAFYISIPPKMRRQCSSISMKKSIDPAMCVPENYRTHTRGLKTKKWFKIYCPRGYKKYATHCSKDCKSGYSRKPFDKCYQKCPRHWSSSWGGTACKKPTKKQGKKQKTCDRFKAKPGRKVNLNLLGECWQTCNSNAKLVLGMCFEKNVLEISIQDIFDAFKKIFDYIKDLPILKEILHAIESAVKFILKPITDLIEKGMKKLGLDGFPNVKEKVLGAEPFKKIAAGIPKPPDFSKLTDFPSQAFDKVMKQLPAPFNKMGDCTGDFDCVLQKAGINREKLQNETMEVVDKAKDTLSDVANITKSLKCDEWAHHTVPVSDILKKAGFPDVDACDIDIPYCKKMDTSALKPLIRGAEKSFEPIFKIFEKKRRRLEEDEDEGVGDIFLPILSLQLTPGLLVDFKAPPEFTFGGEASRLLPQKFKTWVFLKSGGGGEGSDGALERPIGFHVVLELEFALNFGYCKRDRKHSVCLELASKFEVRVSGTFATYSGLMDELLKIPYKLNEGFRESYNYEKCYARPGQKLAAQLKDGMIPKDRRERKLRGRLEVPDYQKSLSDLGIESDAQDALLRLHGFSGHNDVVIGEMFGIPPSFESLRETSPQNETEHRRLPSRGSSGSLANRVIHYNDDYKYDPRAHANLDDYKLLCDTYVKDLVDKMKRATIESGCTEGEMKDLKDQVKKIPPLKPVPLVLGKKIQKCSRFWLRWLDRYEENMEAFYVQESKKIFTRKINARNAFWELLLNSLTIKTDIFSWISADSFGAGVPWIGEAAAKEMLTWGVGFDIFNDAESGSRLSPQFSWAWFGDGPFSFKDNFDGWNVGDLNLGRLLLAAEDAKNDAEVAGFGFKANVDVARVTPDTLWDRIKKRASAGPYAWIQFGGVVFIG